MTLATRPPSDRAVVLFDGDCRFCTQQTRKLVRWFPRAVVARNFQEPGALDAFPGITHEACMKRMHLVTTKGAVYAGAEAGARIVILGLPVLGLAFWLYYVPGVRQLAELLYGVIARYRYRIAGKTVRCDPGGTCHLHDGSAPP